MVINKNKKLQNANTCLISNLAWSDFGFGIVTFLDIIFLSNSVPYSSFQFVANALASIYFLVSVAVERYFAILKPFMHLKRASKSVMWKGSLAIWILVGILSAGGYFVNSMSWQYCCQNATMNATTSLQLANVTTGASVWLEIFSTIYVFVLLVFGFVLPSAVIIFCYSVIRLSRLVQHQRQGNKSCRSQVTTQINKTLYYPHYNISVYLDSYIRKTHRDTIWKWRKRHTCPIYTNRYKSSKNPHQWNHWYQWHQWKRRQPIGALFVNCIY